MRIHADEEIIEKALSKIDEGSLGESGTKDVAVDFNDEDGVTHSYVVSFKKEPAGATWIPIDISEISSL